MNVRASLDRLTADASLCRRCRFHSTRTQVVFGSGNGISSRIMAIGEAPGRNEDERGLPFVGRAGRLLRAVLIAIGINDLRIYITNILKCRPPDNRFTEDEEPIEKCDRWLRDQIRILEPAVILTIGRHSTERFLPEQVEEQGITKLAGRSFRATYEGEPLRIFPVLHPSYVLRQKNERGEEAVEEFAAQLIAFREYLKKHDLFEAVRIRGEKK